MRTLPVEVLVLALGVSLSGCGDSTTQPSPVPQVSAPPPVPAPQPIDAQLTGYVFDSAFRPLAGGVVEALDGPRVGTSATADEKGQFELPGTFSSTTTFRASKPGFVAESQTWTPSSAPSMRILLFYLSSTIRPVAVADVYTLTLIADSQCGFADDRRQRTYVAHVVPDSRPGLQAGTRFNVTLSEVEFFETSEGFTIGVSADYVSLAIGRGVERVAPGEYMAFYGRAGTSVATPSLSTISVPFDGGIELCMPGAPMGQVYECPTGFGGWCVSDNHRLILTR